MATTSTGISWTHRTWNPMRGCALASPGCTHCYAMARAYEIELQGGRAGEAYAGLVTLSKGLPVWNGSGRMAPDDVLNQPLRWTRPHLIFTNSMSDVFFDAFTEEEIFQVLDIMRRAHWHIFQVLTKRADRMADVVGRYLDARGIGPLSNVWFGVSVEDQRRAEQRLPDLARTPAAVRWVSAEPLLGPLDLEGFPAPDWIVVGGESIDHFRASRGERARPFDITWARGIKTWSEPNGVAFHFKQLGDNPVGWSRSTRKGDAMEEFPEDLQVRDWPAAIAHIEEARLPL